MKKSLKCFVVCNEFDSNKNFIVILKQFFVLERRSNIITREII